MKKHYPKIQLLESDNQDQYFIEDNPNYFGLNSYTKSSKFVCIPCSSTYKFPVLPGSIPSCYVNLDEVRSIILYIT